MSRAACLAVSLASIKLDLTEEVQGRKVGERKPASTGSPFLDHPSPLINGASDQAQPCPAIYCSSAAMRLASDGWVEANSGVDPCRCSDIRRHRATASDGR